MCFSVNGHKSVPASLYKQTIRGHSMFHFWPRYSTFRAHNYNDVIMSAMASQIISLTIVYPIVYSGADQRKHQSSASLAFVRGIHRWPVNSPHKRPVTRKMFPFNAVIMSATYFGSLAVYILQLASPSSHSFDINILYLHSIWRCCYTSIYRHISSWEYSKISVKLVLIRIFECMKSAVRIYRKWINMMQRGYIPTIYLALNTVLLCGLT